MRRWPPWAIAFLAIRIAVPAWQLTRARPARFGWQMYAARAQASNVAAVARDGTTTPVALDDYILGRRDDLELLRFLPPAICARTGAAAIRYRDAASHPIELACRR